MALTGAQKVTVAEITRETYAAVNTAAADLNADQETWVVAKIAEWATVNSHVRLKDGKHGIDFDQERDREEIRQEIRKAFGWPLVSDEYLALNPNAMSIFELEVGSNFG